MQQWLNLVPVLGGLANLAAAMTNLTATIIARRSTVSGQAGNGITPAAASASARDRPGENPLSRDAPEQRQAARDWPLMRLEPTSGAAGSAPVTGPRDLSNNGTMVGVKEPTLVNATG